MLRANNAYKHCFPSTLRRRIGTNRLTGGFFPLRSPRRRAPDSRTPTLTAIPLRRYRQGFCALCVSQTSAPPNALTVTGVPSESGDHQQHQLDPTGRDRGVGAGRGSKRLVSAFLCDNHKSSYGKDRSSGSGSGSGSALIRPRSPGHSWTVELPGVDVGTGGSGRRSPAQPVGQSAVEQEEEAEGLGRESSAH
jgi:hypothetical protein